MNTCLSSIYLKFSKLDSRYFRLALIVLALVAGGHTLASLPISGDCGI